MPRTPRASSDGAGIHTVVLTMTPPSADEAGQRGELLGLDRGEVQQDVDRLGHRGGHLDGGVVDDLVGARAAHLVARCAGWRSR